VPIRSNHCIHLSKVVLISLSGGIHGCNTKHKQYKNPKNPNIGNTKNNSINHTIEYNMPGQKFAIFFSFCFVL
jgi:hypothetical protein